RPPHLLQWLVYHLGHLEHVDRGLAAEDRLQGGVGLDHPLVLRILELVLLDVGPELLGDFRPRDCLRADDFRQRRTRVHGLHERGVRLSCGLLLRSCLLSHLISFEDLSHTEGAVTLGENGRRSTRHRLVSRFGESNDKTFEKNGSTFSSKRCGTRLPWSPS